MGITVDELLREWQDTPEPTGKTTEEIALELGRSERSVRLMLKKGLADGTIVARQEYRKSTMRPGWHFWATVYDVEKR